jgi:hypothetical protein
MHLEESPIGSPNRKNSSCEVYEMTKGRIISGHVRESDIDTRSGM